MDDANTPATKADIALILTELRAMSKKVESLDQKVGGLEQRVESLKQDLEDFKVEVNRRFQEFEHRMEQNLLDMKGKIITSNYRLADSIQQRLNQTESNQAALIGRLATIEARLTDLERRSNMPPQAQR
jgi:chromosome segregation ATPase